MTRLRAVYRLASRTWRLSPTASPPPRGFPLFPSHAPSHGAAASSPLRRHASSMSAAADGGSGGAHVSSKWPVGSWDDPVPIASSGDARVVGCTGPLQEKETQHALTWITVEKGRLCQCPCCRQVFKLEVRGGE